MRIAVDARPLCIEKASGIPTVTYAEALDEALCLGWIDGQKKSFDETAFLQKFTKRGKRSVWSKINVGHVARLEKEGRMKPAGLAAVAAAKVDGRWAAAYHSFRTAEMPEDFLTALAGEPEAKAFFDTLNKTHHTTKSIATNLFQECRRHALLDSHWRGVDQTEARASQRSRNFSDGRRTNHYFRGWPVQCLISHREP